MSQILLVATTNPGKLREIQALLAGLPLEVRALPPDTDIVAPEETGETFAENARLKARYYAQATGLLTVAEDSGLEIDALNGRPGVLSARYPGATYEERFRNLYAELSATNAPTTATVATDAAAETTTASDTNRGGDSHSDRHGDSGSGSGNGTGSGNEDEKTIPSERGVNPAWTARFVAALALARGEEILFEARGTVEGFIASEPRGADGFGYDPIFFYPPYGRTFGEATKEEKSEVSHRGAAFRALRSFLEAAAAR